MTGRNRLAESPAIDRARRILTESKNATPAGEPGESAKWWGRLEVTLADVLAAIDEGASR